MGNRADAGDLGLLLVSVLHLQILLIVEFLFLFVPVVYLPYLLVFATHRVPS